VRRWPTPRAAFVFSAPVDADCHILRDNFCKVFGLLLSGKYGLLRILKVLPSNPTPRFALPRPFKEW
jgi:hypothetical protein